MLNQRSKPSGGRPTRRKSRVVIDTGVLVSAFVFGGVPARAVKKAFSESLLYVSPELLREYRDVPQELLEAGKINAMQFEILIAGIATVVSTATVTTTGKKLKISRDPEDDMVLECCLAARAAFLITGDKDLLTIETLPFPLTIMTPADFLAS